ncbi:HAD family hydrolase [Salipiger mangrovisoli]|uniref:HAD family phosphatase n=1 Tax=Salipiger mangrovisoli TaxID=2865933 RepID=A0ABR9WXT0_9RHOB|nr:HAD family phosphatase [Salipiger mangrovisoli]MBE9636084.1 HAD family phosphatase [Salipiger mangrovisoli]
MTIEAVVLDIGNVLIEWQPERYYDRLMGEERRRKMFAEIDLHDMNDRVDRGEDFRSTVYEAAVQNPDWHDEVRHWHDHWIDLASPEIPESVALLRALRARGVPVFALSNFGIGTFEIAEEAYPFLGEFDRRFISGHMGVTKPDAEIYARLEAESGVAPERLLFTDDREENIAAAAARGWQVHLFERPEAWERCLISHGLLPERDAA